MSSEKYIGLLTLQT